MVHLSSCANVGGLQHIAPCMVERENDYTWKSLSIVFAFYIGQLFILIAFLIVLINIFIRCLHPWLVACIHPTGISHEKLDTISCHHIYKSLETDLPSFQNQLLRNSESSIAFRPNLWDFQTAGQPEVDISIAQSDKVLLLF